MYLTAYVVILEVAFCTALPERLRLERVGFEEQQNKVEHAAHTIAQLQIRR